LWKTDTLVEMPTQVHLMEEAMEQKHTTVASQVVA
jgi:hypothetical protein